MGRVDVALKEYDSLRAEILAHTQAQTTLVSVALTATAAIAGFAFGAKADEAQRLQILLALPLVLSGLGLAYLTHSYGTATIGRYIKERLWPTLKDAVPDDGQGLTTALPSWEKQLSRGGKALLSPGGFLSWLPGLITFGAPSVAALAINSGHASLPWVSNTVDGLGWAWLVDAVIAVVALVLLVWVGFTEPDLAEDTPIIEDRREERIAIVLTSEFGGQEFSGKAELRSSTEQ
jgi:hypothetical protein